MIIRYEIVATIINLTNTATSKFTKQFEIELLDSPLMYDNTHILVNNANILNIFKDEIKAYCIAWDIEDSSVDVDEFEVTSLTDNVDVFFEEPKENVIPLSPTLKCYIYPKHEALKTPKLVGIAYDSTTIIWSWPEDEEYAHYLIDETYDTTEGTTTSIIAQIPIGQKTYTETGLNPDTSYTRRLVNYTVEQTSEPSNSVTVTTETVELSKKLSEYNIARNYDFTTPDSERECIQENLEAFHSGIGDFNDLKVYKQMDADFYQKFKAYFEIIGRRTQREKRYSQVGFNYKVCLEALEEIEEQEGEVTFDVNVFPRQWVSLQDYMWETYPVTVRTRLKCSVFLRKEVEATEDEPHYIYRPVYEPKWVKYPLKAPIDSSYEKDMSIIISMDMSSSLRFSAQNTGVTRLALEISGAIRLIDFYELTIKNELPDANIQWVIYLWGNLYKFKKFVTNNYKQAKDYVQNATYFNGSDGRTCFYQGLNGWNGLATNPKKVCIFFTDGYPNVNNVNNKKTYHTVNKSGYMSVVDSLSITAPTAILYLTSITDYDQDLSDPEGQRALARLCKEKLDSVCGAQNVFLPDTIMSKQTVEEAVEWAKENTLDLLKKPGGIDPNPQDKKFNGYWFHWDGTQWTPQEVLDALEDPEDEELQKLAENWVLVSNENSNTVWNHLEGIRFKEWVTDEQGVNLNKYEIDDTTYVNVTIEFDPMKFQNGTQKAAYYSDGYFNCVTPISYDRTERRAIIPGSSHLINSVLTINGQVRNIYEIILEQAMASAAWAQGYNKTIGTKENTGEEDMYLVKGLMIQNTYDFGDDDASVNDPSFGLNTWADGWNGTVNTYTDINTLGTTTYGDDCYLVSRNNYVMVQGFTDAIIYDGTRYPTEELNGYDRPSSVLVSTSADYKSLLTCRKLSTLSYSTIGGTEQPYHAFDVIQKGDDIFFTGQSNVVSALNKIQDWVDAGKLTEDLIGHNERQDNSPVLNYRFNLEDPDAKTPLYEILPTCNPYSSDLNIVLLHVYYAKNVYITSEDNYVEQYSDNPLKNTSDPFIPLEENVYKWTLKEWHDGYGNDNGWYIDNYLWFMSKPMIKIQDYYDEIPRPGMDVMYGLVNSRYKSDNQDGKEDLVIQTPKFNIPTTVTDKHLDSVRIYILVSEFYPSDALVSYKWDHPYNNIDSITDYYGNGDYVTFKSDSITYKDVEYKELISTINYENIEVFDNKTNENTYELEKPETVYEYDNYYLTVETDNSDVLPIRYPNELQFDENDKTQINVAFKGVVNATSKWCPRIHNGYYYLNQHEYFAYSEFDVKANFEHYEENVLKTMVGYVAFNVTLKHIGAETENYNILKNTRSELLQDEKNFIWVNGQGLTVKPEIDGEYFKQYNSCLYTSPILMFNNILTTVGKLNVEYEFEDGSTYLPMEVRSYNLDEGRWNEWQPFVNNSVPIKENGDGTVEVLYSNAYQVRFFMQGSVENRDYTFEDYLCCYLDWKDDMSEQNLTNIETVMDYVTNGPDVDAEGIYVSKIIDFGCTTTVNLSYFDSMYNNHVKMFAAASDNENMLLIENITWVDITNKNLENRESALSEDFNGRYFRYKFIIEPGEKLYWLHKIITTSQTSVIRPFIKSISMSGQYAPSDTITNFINTEAIEIPTDGELHEVFENALSVIGSDVLARGFEYSEIQKIDISCTSPSITLDYNVNLNSDYPDSDALNQPISASSPFDYTIKTNYTSYIYSELDDYNNECIKITGTPQQFAPITVEDVDGNTYIELFDETDLDLSKYGYKAEDALFMQLTEEFVIDESSVKFLTLKRNTYEKETFKLYLNDVILDNSLYELRNHMVIFESELSIGDNVRVEYFIPKSFNTEIDRVNNTTTIRLYNAYNDLGVSEPESKKYKVYFETGKHNNKFIAEDLSLNPVYRTDYKGFIYLTDEHNEPYTINIYCNPTYIKAGGYDKVDISVEVLDILKNPIINKKVNIDCNYGILNIDSNYTDMNGVVHMVYESAYLACVDILEAKVTLDDGTILSNSITILNE